MGPPETDAEKAFEYDRAKDQLMRAGLEGGLNVWLVQLIGAWRELAERKRAE